MSFIKTAYDIARKQVFFCNSSDSLTEVARLMHTNNIGSVLVKSGDKVSGIITVNDILRQVSQKKNPCLLKAKDIMSSPVRMISKDIEIDDLAEEFRKYKVTRMVLQDAKGDIVGVVRDIAVYKYFTFFRYDTEIREMFGADYSERFY